MDFTFHPIKKVLEIGIALSGRKDRDYQKIVDSKYQRILFRVYLNAGELEKAKECYFALNKANDVQTDDYRLYLERFHPAKYKVFCLKNLGIRAIRKAKRILTGK